MKWFKWIALGAVLAATTVSSQEQANIKFKREEAKSVCKTLDHNYTLVYPCSVNGELQTLEIILPYYRDPAMFEMQTNLICTVARHLAVAHSFEFQTEWVLEIYSVEENDPIKTCPLTYITKAQ